MSEKKVSVVICTYQRVNLLKGVVKSLIKQSASPSFYEVIIVDNEKKKNQGVQRIVKETQSYIDIYYIHEPRVGLSFARNTGGKRSQSDYVCYIDDDAIVNSKYLEYLCEIVRDRKPDICGGPYFPFYFGKKPRWYRDIYGTKSLGNEPRYLNSREYLSGGNIVFSYQLLENIGWFSTSLGMSGKKLGYGEETLAILNAHKYKPNLFVYYDPRLYIYHLVPAHKMSICNILFRAFKRGDTQAYLWLSKERHKIVRKRALIGLFYNLYKTAQCFMPGILLRNRKKYPFWQNYIVEVVTRFAELIGANIRYFIDFIRQNG